jgi:hypothetical protein
MVSSSVKVGDPAIAYVDWNHRRLRLPDGPLARGMTTWCCPRAKMSPDLYFALTLIVKMAITAGFVLAATVTAERAGPLVGGLVATLPIGAGPVYVFLALDHDAHFIAQGAVASLAINAVNVIFATVYVLLAQRRSLLISLSVGLAVWAALAPIIHWVHWTVFTALVMNIVVLGVCLWLVRPLRHVTMPPVYRRWYDLAMRAVLVAILVGVTVGLSFRIGAAGSGILAVFPVVLISIMLILHNRVGGRPTAAVLANAPLGLIGFGFACVMLHFSAERLGVALGLALALATSIGWSLAVLTARRHGIQV